MGDAVCTCFSLKDYNYRLEQESSILRGNQQNYLEDKVKN